MSAAEDYFRSGNLAQALAQLQADVRERPVDSKLRIFLAQLLMVVGEWDRALMQLKVLEDMDDAALLMVRTYQVAINCERLRERVFSGERSPLVFGDPQPWLALLVASLRLLNEGHAQQASELRAEALEQAPPSTGSLNGESFEWVADADSRLGPVLEVLVDGNYFWMPFSRIKRVAMEPPSDIRDLIWLPAQIILSNGGEVAALIPARYPGSAAVDDTEIRMARRTEWRNLQHDTYVGVGQRMFTTDASEIGLFDLRDLIIHETPAAAVWH